jgi:tetratricopeptide (TPR) repeat protein
LKSRATRLALTASLVIAASCKKPPPPSGAVSSPPPPPVVQAERQTTDGRIAVNNLDAQVGASEHLLGGPQNDFALASLIPLLATRAQFLGRVEDYDVAAGHADTLVRARPKDGGAYLARAAVRSSLHLFELAIADLDEAQKLGVPAAKVDPARAITLHAMGRTKEALALQERLVANDPSMGNLGALALMVGDQGKHEEADALFERAPASYRDVSPFPVAWLDFQRGQMWERAGQATQARGFYEAAVARLPAYATAQAHLAGLQAAQGDREGAIARLRQVTKSASDPEFVGQLAGLLQEVGRADEAASLKVRAQAEFERLLEKHPEAFSDHAARFYLGAGGDPPRALKLARLNLDNRTTPEAFDLALTAALEAKDSAAACDFADRTRGKLSPLPTPHLEFLTQKADTACGRGQQTQR